MTWLYYSALLGLVQLPFSATAPNCPLIGAEFPPPQQLAGHPTWIKAINNLTANFDYIDAINAWNPKTFSYSIQIFSTNPGAPIVWERYRTARDLPSDNPGVKAVDGDTVYRIGSVSKVFTVLAFLRETGDLLWNVPITKLIPELQEQIGRSDASDFDSVRETSWDDVTIGALASQVSGLGRDYGVLGEITQTEDAPLPWQIGFTTLPDSEKPPCGAWFLCSRQEFFDGLFRMYPSYPPWQTATYSNIAYQLLAYALEEISGKPFAETLNDNVIEPLGLSRTYYESAPASVGIIPGTVEDTYWNVSLGDASPGGNMYSSANDISSLGRAILSSKLLRPSLTRRWLNPITFSADILAAVGAPWGVRRIQLSPTIQPHRTISTFTKAGTFRKHTAFLTLLREFGLGFTIMMAGSPVLNNFKAADMIGESLIPAYDAVAREEADRLYSGVYANYDSFLVIRTDPNKPGLGIGPWISNKTDMVRMAFVLQAGSNDIPWGALPPPQTEARLYYTQLESPNPYGGRKQSWKAVFEDTSGPSTPPKLFSTNCASWVGVTGVTYDSLPLDGFIFNLDDDGKVVSIENLALRTTLYKLT